LLLRRRNRRTEEVRKFDFREAKLAWKFYSRCEVD
jgi:hypothetical protein